MGTRREAEKRALEVLRILTEGSHFPTKAGRELAVLEEVERLEPRAVAAEAREIVVKDLLRRMAEINGEFTVELDETMSKNILELSRHYTEYINLVAEDPVAYHAIELIHHSGSMHLAEVYHSYIRGLKAVGGFLVGRLITGEGYDLQISQSGGGSGFPLAPPGDHPQLED